MKLHDRDYYENEATFEEWKEWYDGQERGSYIHPDVATDAVIVRFDPIDKKLKMLLTKRIIHPYKDTWTLPGTFLHSDESDVIVSLKRMFTEKLNTSLPEGAMIDQLKTYSGINRDPRGQVVSVVNMIYTNEYIEETETIKWFDIDTLEYYDTVNRGFDHYKIIIDAIERMKSQFNWLPYTIYTLPNKFTLGQLVHLKESLFWTNTKKTNRANFRKSMLKFIKKVGTTKDDVTLYSVRKMK